MSIANQVKSLTEDIEVSYGTRIAAVSDIVKETHQILGSFRRTHKKMADDLNSSLSAGNKDRVNEVGKIRAENAKDLKEMARTLSSSLDEGESARIAEFKEMLKSIQSRQKEREDETAELLSDYQKDLSETRGHWQNLAKVMAAKRAGKSIPSAKAKMGVPAAVKEAAEEAFEEGELKDRVLRVIQANPGGMRLPEIGKALKVAYVQVAKPVKDLLAEVKITKQDSEYLPT